MTKQAKRAGITGVIAFSSDFVYSSLDEIISAREENRGFVVLCDGIEDVHNLGSIIRVAECAGADGVVIPSNNSASVTDAVIRISAGAVNHIRVAKVNSINARSTGSNRKTTGCTPWKPTARIFINPIFRAT